MPTAGESPGLALLREGDREHPAFEGLDGGVAQQDPGNLALLAHRAQDLGPSLAERVRVHPPGAARGARSGPPRGSGRVAAAFLHGGRARRAARRPVRGCLVFRAAGRPGPLVTGLLVTGLLITGGFGTGSLVMGAFPARPFATGRLAAGALGAGRLGASWFGPGQCRSGWSSCRWPDP